jgi:hypothetical protein
MRCDEFDNRVHRLLDQRGTLDQDGVLSRHANTCSRCALRWQAYLDLQAGLDAWETPDVSPDFARRVVARIQPVAPVRRTTARWMAVALAMAATMLIAVIPLSYRRSARVPSPGTAEPVATSRPSADPDRDRPGANGLLAGTKIGPRGKKIPRARQIAPPPSPNSPLAAPVVESQDPLGTLADDRAWPDKLAELTSRVTSEQIASVGPLYAGIRPITSTLTEALDVLRDMVPWARNPSKPDGDGDSAWRQPHSSPRWTV